MPRGFDIDLRQYAHLRTMLDSVTVGALRYYLNVNSYKEQQEHYAYLDKHLNDMVEKVWNMVKNTECPDGYVDCNGCCVPYNCVIGSDINSGL